MVYLSVYVYISVLKTGQPCNSEVRQAVAEINMCGNNA